MSSNIVITAMKVESFHESHIDFEPVCIKKSDSRLYISLSKMLEKIGRIEIGL